MRPSQTQDKFIVRLPDGMREQISQAASTNNRSMTAEIVARLGWSFENENDQKRTGLASVKTAKALTTNALTKRLEALEADVAALKAKQNG